MVRAGRHRPQRRSFRPAQRGVGPVRARRRSVRHRHRDRPVRRAARRDVSRPPCDRRRRRRPHARPAARAPLDDGAGVARSTASSALPSPSPRSRRCSPRSDSPRRAGSTHDGSLTVSIPSWRPDCAHRDRRHRGDRPALRLRAARQASAPLAVARSAVTAPAAPSPAARGAARARADRGAAEPVPRPRHPDAGRARPPTPCGSPTRWWPRRACCAPRCDRAC